MARLDTPELEQLLGGALGVPRVPGQHSRDVEQGGVREPRLEELGCAGKQERCWSPARAGATPASLEVALEPVLGQQWLYPLGGVGFP